MLASAGNPPRANPVALGFWVVDGQWRVEGCSVECAMSNLTTTRAIVTTSCVRTLRICACTARPNAQQLERQSWPFRFSVLPLSGLSVGRPIELRRQVQFAWRFRLAPLTLLRSSTLSYVAYFSWLFGWPPLLSGAPCFFGPCFCTVPATVHQQCGENFRSTVGSRRAFLQLGRAIFISHIFASAGATEEVESDMLDWQISEQ